MSGSDLINKGITLESNMKKMIGLLFCLAFGSANAALLTFDDISDGSTPIGNVSTYKNFNFSSNLVWIDVVGTPRNYGAVSGEFGLLNNEGSIGVITAATGASFSFDGLWAKLWGRPTDSGGADTLHGSISGYNNGNLVWNTNTSLNGSYEFYADQTGEIDELRLDLGDHFLIDDIALTSIATSVVPVPAAAWLFGSGLIGLVGIRKKRNHTV